jgi:uncharacterized protein (TIGR02246 family)
MQRKQDMTTSVLTSSENTGFTPVDWIAVHQLIARYVDAADRHDPDQMRSCWTEDGVFIAPDGKEVRSQDGIVAHEVNLWKQAVATGTRRRHCITSILIVTSSSSRVTTRVGMVGTNMTDDGARVESTYRAEDVIVKDGDEWRYAFRRLIPD